MARRGPVDEVVKATHPPQLFCPSLLDSTCWRARRKPGAPAEDDPIGLFAQLAPTREQAHTL